MSRPFLRAVLRAVLDHLGPLRQPGPAAAGGRIAQREDPLKACCELVPVPLQFLDEEHRILAVSDRWLALLGYERGDVVGRSITAFMTETSAARFDALWREQLDGAALLDHAFQFRRRSGEIVDAMVSCSAERDAQGAFRRGVAALIDLTETRRADRLLRQAQRLDAAARLAGGLAHDLNNLLSVVNGNIEIVLPLLADDKPRRRLKSVLEATARMETMTRQMLAFAGARPPQSTVIDIGEYLTHLRALLQRSLRSDIIVKADVDPGLWPVAVDAEAFDLAILQLAVAARDAMPQGGVLRITARNVNPPAGADRGLDLAGEFVALELADTGAGLAPDMVERIFEPFFTAKDQGKGTGLGLSQVYGFARQSGGAAVAASREGAGTTVTLYLPRSVRADDAVPPRPVPAPVRRAHFLVVDDDPDVAQMAAGMLGQLGYVASIATSAEAALERLGKGESFDLVLSDVVMPGLGGLGLAAAISKLYPHLPVILTTGYSTELDKASGIVRHVLQKPYRASLLEGAIRRCLGAGGGVA